MRIIIKGGVWKNTEDEILKAAVMKYGKNQWARISSLLTRKTPKQCKARWFEWLDPSIKKTEWAKEEDEKLLHLAKLMPTQWRTIAPIVGRTAGQCLERYQRLLDDAEIKDETDKGPTGDDVRKLRPGEVDPDPEAKPARPDPVDMDEDEKEMLSEARARLANTHGKKAKRKAREKQLEEARRLSNLQKNRELKAAGIVLIERKKRKGGVPMNYNADIPFQKKAPVGFFDISTEMDREVRERKDMSNVILQKLEGKRRQEIEDEALAKDSKRQKTKKETGVYVPPDALKATKDLQMSERKRLFLPEPQVNDAELAEIIKIGYAGESTRAVVDADGFAPSTSLLGSYSTMPNSTPLRTPRSSDANYSLKTEARNLRAMTESQTPLFGDNVSLEGQLEFGGAAPKKSILSTPNPLSAQLTPRLPGDTNGMTPRSSILQKTPRDEMGINTPRVSSSFDETPLGSSRDFVASTLNFSRLPKPKNDFEIIVPEKYQEQEETEVIHRVEDMSDVQVRVKLQADKKRQEALRRRS